MFPYKFQSPKWYTVLFFLSLMIILVQLGQWQLVRADEKRQMLSQYETLQKKIPVDLSKLDLNNAKNYEPVSVTGHFDQTHQIFLDNQFFHHELGYEVFVPFECTNCIQKDVLKINTSQPVHILVSLGWVKAPKNRQDIPDTPSLDALHTLKGTLYFPKKQFHLFQSNTLVLDSFQKDMFWPKRIEFLEPKTLKALNSNYPFVLRLTSPTLSGLQHDWTIVSMPPERHTGYAIQWFAMAFVLFLLFIRVHLTRR